VFGDWDEVAESAIRIADATLSELSEPTEAERKAQEEKEEREEAERERRNYTPLLAMCDRLLGVIGQHTTGQITLCDFNVAGGTPHGPRCDCVGVALREALTEAKGE